MTILKDPYKGTNECSNKIMPGVVGALKYCVEAYPKSSAGGIASECSIEPSVHAEGRAFRLNTGELPTWAAYLTEFFYRYSKDLGVQCVIWNKKIWSCRYPDDGWRPYTGTETHTKYIHVELTLEMANRSAKQVQSVWDYVSKYADVKEPTYIDPEKYKDESKDNLEWS